MRGRLRPTRRAKGDRLCFLPGREIRGRVVTLADLAKRWRTEAELLEVHGADQAAATARLHAAQLEVALRDQDDQELTLAEAVQESGCSGRRLRELISEGRVPNAGRTGAPRIRRADLPRKARGTGGTDFDAAAEARAICGGGR